MQILLFEGLCNIVQVLPFFVTLKSIKDHRIGKDLRVTFFHRIIGRKEMKRLVALALCAMMAIGLCACGDSAASGTGAADAGAAVTGEAAAEEGEEAAGTEAP